ncbi:RpiB/LacA/LacB family sugar-phosphate isomerase [Candidatus Dependentiae bacterium]|nr:RpiB/LacA/LacB family sugar-phosphate isomerase [Candidatus Dependentiae bacterium]
MDKDIIKIAIGSDHRGYEFKEYIKKSAEHPSKLIVWNDVGAYTTERSDYPEFAISAAKLFLNKEVECSVLLCGTGIGMAIAANRYKGIYSGVAFTEAVARSAKEDDNVNFLVLPSDYLTDLEVVACVNTWLKSKFKGERYEQRIKMIDAIK